ncbi:MAG: DUF1127 domain-containing protein [Granulosicoccaceae bacterium]
MFKKLIAFVAKSQEIRARRLVREQLLAMPNHRLEDLGFDRAALTSGLNEWPWRIEGPEFIKPETESQPVFSRRELRQAERELAAMSDRELHELGIARSDIRAAVNGDLVRVA